ncbi:hypothetical protein M0R45_008877 [Rubus argutus]|uniref:Uncharacterized protein n=1 Tax=Rubus argutus TaxID=59490 RepID=A0AAW1Y3C0_RUBAR
MARPFGSSWLFLLASLCGFLFLLCVISGRGLGDVESSGFGSQWCLSIESQGWSGVAAFCGWSWRSGCFSWPRRSDGLCFFQLYVSSGYEETMNSGGGGASMLILVTGGDTTHRGYEGMWLLPRLEE